MTARLGIVPFWKNYDRTTVLRTAQLAEDLGYDSIWVPEAWAYEQFQLLTEIALATKTLGLATGDRGGIGGVEDRERAHALRPDPREDRARSRGRRDRVGRVRGREGCRASRRGPAARRGARGRGGGGGDRCAPRHRADTPAVRGSTVSSKPKTSA